MGCIASFFRRIFQSSPSIPPDPTTSSVGGGLAVRESGLEQSKPHDMLIRLFLIGCGEVGKSTLLKQMQNLCLTEKSYQMYDDQWDYTVPFKEEERRRYRLTVHQNVLRIIGTLIAQVEDMGLIYSVAQHAKFAREIMRHMDGDLETVHQRPVSLTPDLARKIEALWTKDEAIARAWSRRREFLVSDSTEYFLAPAKLRSLASADYIPSVDDILRVRDPTTGIRDYNFRLHRIPFSIHDTGGQPVEMARLYSYLRPWLARTQPRDKNFILYVASLSHYNQAHPRYPDKTLLDESVELLKILLGMNELRDCGFIIFLNKLDIFQEKISKDKDLHKYFGSYIEYGKNSTNSPQRLVASRFAEAVNTTDRYRENFYCKFTTAIDKGMMQAIFAAVRKDIIDETINNWNLL